MRMLSAFSPHPYGEGVPAAVLRSCRRVVDGMYRVYCTLDVPVSLAHCRVESRGKGGVIKAR